MNSDAFNGFIGGLFNTAGKYIDRVAGNGGSTTQQQQAQQPQQAKTYFGLTVPQIVLAVIGGLAAIWIAKKIFKA